MRLMGLVGGCDLKGVQPDVFARALIKNRLRMRKINLRAQKITFLRENGMKQARS